MPQAADRHTISLGNDCTIFAATALCEQMLALIADADDIEIDLARVTDIDSAGIQLMIAAKKEAAVHNKTLRFVGHSPCVVELLDLLDLTAHLGDPVLLHSRP